MISLKSYEWKLMSVHLSEVGKVTARSAAFLWLGQQQTTPQLARLPPAAQPAGAQSHSPET